jgi:hypothetical protein
LTGQFFSLPVSLMATPVQIRLGTPTVIKRLGSQGLTFFLFMAGKIPCVGWFLFRARISFQSF